MKSLVYAIAVVVLITVAKWAAFLFLPLRYSGTIVPLCQFGTRTFIIAYFLWLFWPYLKRGATYLINHRED